MLSLGMTESVSMLASSAPAESHPRAIPTAKRPIIVLYAAGANHRGAKSLLTVTGQSSLSSLSTSAYAGLTQSTLTLSFDAVEMSNLVVDSWV